MGWLCQELYPRSSVEVIRGMAKGYWSLTPVPGQNTAFAMPSVTSTKTLDTALGRAAPQSASSLRAAGDPERLQEPLIQHVIREQCKQETKSTAAGSGAVRPHIDKSLAQLQAYETGPES